MTTAADVQDLQNQYGDDWSIHFSRGIARASRRRLSLTDEELRAGLAMTLYDGDGGPLADQLAKQQQNEASLLSPAP